MAGKLITMGKVKQILQLSEQGISQREISRRLNVNRKSIVHYIARMDELRLSIQDLLSMPDIELESLMTKRPSLTDTNEEYQYLESLFPYFKKELKETELPDMFSGENTGLVVQGVMVILRCVTITSNG